MLDDLSMFDNFAFFAQFFLFYYNDYETRTITLLLKYNHCILNLIHNLKVYKNIKAL